ncbi:MAG TPA: MarR family transcriptional regulator [Gemmatimonadaceae bacterium]|nr:MarR family transcriptional regulator [Gemmatimonadaceae bacterium]
MTVAALNRDLMRSDPGRGEQASLRTWLRLLTCTNIVEREVRGRLRDKFDTTLPRFDVLAQLDAVSGEPEPHLTMSELSRRLMVTNGNLTSLIERLVHEGLVKRDPAPGDKRTQIVKLTASGKRAFDAMTPEHQRWIDDLFGGLSASERRHLYELLGKLRGSVQESLKDERSR